MIDRARQRLGLRPRRLAADTAYGAAPILKWLMDRGIEPHVPVWDKSRRADGTFSRPDFTYDKGRDIDEDVRDHVRALANTEAFETSRRERKKVERAFAHLKRILKLDRLRLRGLSGARDELRLAATAQNLRKLAIYAARSPPGPRVHCLA